MILFFSKITDFISLILQTAIFPCEMPRASQFTQKLRRGKLFSQIC